MEKNLSNFYEVAPGSDYLLKGIESNIGSTGDLTEIYEIDVIISSITKILTINKGTYLFDPNMGVGIQRYIFEPADLTTKNKILSEIRQAISIYEQRAKIDVDIAFLSNKKGFKINLIVKLGNQIKESNINILESNIKSL